MVQFIFAVSYEIERRFGAAGFQGKHMWHLHNQQIINGKQFAASLQHVDDLKISHKDKGGPIHWLSNQKLWGKWHCKAQALKRQSAWLFAAEMSLDYSEKGAVKLLMKECTRRVSEEFKHATKFKDIKKVSTPAADHLFEANQNCKKLGDNKRKEFYTTLLANSLFCEKGPD